MNTIKLNTIGTPVKKVAGGGASGGGGNYVYYSGTIRDFVELISLVSIIKENKGNEIFFKPAGQFWAEGNELNNVIGVGYDLSMKVSPFEPQEMFTVGDLIAEYSKNWTQITEEEFYKIPPQFVLMHGEVPRGYLYNEGMTWGEWVNSGYSRGEFSIDGEYIEAPNGRVHNQDGSPVKDSDLISDNENYVCIAVPK